MVKFNSNRDSQVSRNNGPATVAPGPIAYMAGNSVAANLLMFAILIAGIVALTGLGRETWHVFSFNHIEVSMAYPGATPEEVEESIVIKIEEQVRALDNVKAVKSVAAPGMASVRVELKSGTDISMALDEIESAVDRIEYFPAGAERPLVREMTNRQSVLRLIVFGDVSERALKELAHQVEDKLGALEEISSVDTSGARRYEISAEIPLARLRALGLTLQDVADAIRHDSFDLSAGSIDTQDGQVRLRTLGKSYVQQDFEEIVVVSGDDGTRLRLGDIADVRDDFQEADLIVRYQGLPAVFVEVYRADDENVDTIAQTVHEHVAAIAPNLPNGTGITVWNDESQTYSERVYLLLKNGILGLLLVLIALALFLEIRLAIWVTVGLATSIVGALAVMLVFDIALNTITLFVFVLAIGIVVDDAIVVAEHIHHERWQGFLGVVAAIRGARRIKVPLVFAVLTSIAAFSPLFFLPGFIGEIWFPLPVIITSILLISLAESLLILPNHLSHLPGPESPPVGGIDRFLASVQGFVDRKLSQFLEGPLDRALRFATDQPLVTMAGAIGVLVVTVSLVPAGIVKTTYVDTVEGDFVVATLEMPDGTTAERTREVAKEIEAAGRRVIERFSQTQPREAPQLLTGVIVTVGQRPRVEGGGVIAEPTLNPEANVATVEFKLVSAQQRDITTGDVADAWRAEVGILPHVRGITFSGEVIDLGSPVEAMLSHPDPEKLASFATTVVDGLRALEGVFDVRSDHAPGVREIQLQLRHEGRNLGLTVEEVARQVRAAFFGVEALRIQRGREEVRVSVRLPGQERNSITDVEDYLVQTPDGSRVPLSHVASLNSGVSPPTIRRRDGQRVVTVTADIDPAVISSGEANRILADTILDNLMAEDPRLSYTYGGEQQQQLDTLSSLYRGFAIAMFMIFALLAIPLRSYTKPLIVMAVIPFGLIGVILGHLLLAVPIGATVLMGFLGLSGVVVNDSLIMIDFIDERLRKGASARTAIIEGAKGRFRPIFLTSVTTFLGFTPLILERAIQAQFLRPFAASIGFGILVTTAMLIVVVPALYSLRLRLAPRSSTLGLADGTVPIAKEEPTNASPE